MGIRLVAPGHAIALDVSHHAVTGGYHGRCKGLLQLFLLFPILGPAVLEPDLWQQRGVALGEEEEEGGEE